MIRGALALTIAFGVLVACKGEARKAPAGGAGSGSGSSAPVAAEPPEDPRLAALPGELWFVEDGPPQRLVRIVAGVRMTIEAPLFPSASRILDGGLVAIRSHGDGSPDSEQIVLVGKDGTQTPVGPSAPQVRDPVAEPWGKWIVAAFQLDGHSDLYRVEPATGTMTRLTNNPEGNFHPVRFRADSIAFVSSRDGDSEIYSMTLSTGKEQRLTAFHKDDWDPIPSPDGAMIAFTSDREGPPRVCLIKWDGTGFRRLTDRGSTGSMSEVEESSAQWSTNGELAYLVREKGRSVLVVEGSSLTPAGASDSELAWAPDGQWIAVVRTIGRASQLVVIRPSAHEPAIVVSRGSAQLPRWFWETVYPEPPK